MALHHVYTCVVSSEILEATKRPNTERKQREIIEKLRREVATCDNVAKAQQVKNRQITKHTRHQTSKTLLKRRTVNKIVKNTKRRKGKQILLFMVFQKITTPAKKKKIIGTRIMQRNL